MILSTFGVIFGSYSTGGARSKYNGFKFEQTPEGYYKVSIDKNPLLFAFHPNDLLTINYTEGTAALLKQAVVVPIILESNISADTLQYADMLKFDMMDIAKLPIASASSEENNNGWPVLSCANATSIQPIIIVREAESPSIRKEGYCITIEAKGFGMMSVHDRLIYTLKGVMDDN
jgi:hypothetical protein